MKNKRRGRVKREEGEKPMKREKE
jgi:hypothetical protein